MNGSNVLKVVGVVAALFLAMLLLSLFGPDKAKVADALDWSKALAGIFLTIAGVGSSAMSLMASAKGNQLLGVGPGVVGVLAGSTLLGVGGWAAPVALGVTAAGMWIGYALKKP